VLIGVIDFASLLRGGQFRQRFLFPVTATMFRNFVFVCLPPRLKICLAFLFGKFFKC
jgi:hypothetical protein